MSVYTFVILDHHYYETSLISLYSFYEHNPDIIVHIYCIDFNDSEIESYKKFLNIPLYKIHNIKSDIKLCYDWNWYYRDIINYIYLKFKIMSNISDDYIHYFDLDTIYIKSIGDLFQQVNGYDFAGVSFNNTRKECNCGMFVAKNKYIDYGRYFIDYFDCNSDNEFNIDECFLASIYNNILYLPVDYNATGTCRSNNPIMIHYIGTVKPFSIGKLPNIQCGHPLYYMNYWYDYFNKLQGKLPVDYINTINTVKNKLSKNTPPTSLTPLEKICKSFKYQCIPVLIKYMKNNTHYE